MSSGRVWTAFMALLLLMPACCVSAFTVDVKSLQVCEGQTAEINCTYGNPINILYAMYGRSTEFSDTCSLSKKEGSCISANSISHTKSQCQGRLNCSFIPNHVTFGGDPCVGVTDYLFVNYTCGNHSSDINSLKVCESQTAAINCTNGNPINILYAMYGRSTEFNATCSVNKRQSSCMVSNGNPLSYTQSQCNGRLGCSFVVTNPNFGGDPCGSTMKYMFVNYTCGNFSSALSVLSSSWTPRNFHRPDTCSTAAVTAIGNITVKFGLSECIVECNRRDWCAAVRHQLGGCTLFDWRHFYNLSFGTGGDCPMNLFVVQDVALQLNFTSCHQVSTESNAVCNRAIDGITNQDLSANSCSSTIGTVGDWWQAQLQQLAFIGHIAIYNRQDCCASRLNNFTVKVDGAECVRFYDASSFSVRNFSCGRVGQNVRIEKDDPSPLTLCEVTVYGKYLK